METVKWKPGKRQRINKPAMTMFRYQYILTLALFLGTATFAGAQEKVRTAAEIQAEIAQLQIELQKANEAEGIIPGNPALILTQRPESEKKLLRLLETPITLKIDEITTFNDLMRIFALQLGEDLPVYFDGREFRNLSNTVRPDVIVHPEGNFSVSNVKAKNILKKLLEQHDLAHVVKDEMLIITTREAARRRENMTIKVYYVGDIAPEVSLGEKINTEKMIRDMRSTNPETVEGTMGGSVVGGGSGGFMYYPRHYPIAHFFDRNSPFYNYIPINSLREVIQMSIETDSWWDMDAGGDAELVIYEPTQSLIVRQTDEVHIQIEELLSNLRKMHALHQSAQAVGE